MWQRTQEQKSYYRRRDRTGGGVRWDEHGAAGGETAARGIPTRGTGLFGVRERCGCHRFIASRIDRAATVAL